MSAAVMSHNFYPGFQPVDQGHAANSPLQSQLRVQQWMLAQQMASSYPAPHNNGEHQHYNAFHPAPAAQQLLDGQEVQFSAINQPLYAKVESAPSEQASTNHQINSLAHDLQHHTSFGDQRRHLAQAAQHVQHHSPHLSPGPGHPVHAQHAGQDQNQKPNRLRKACDSCSIRKVKCDEAGPPCRACSALDIPCTFDRPSRRRGPPNRHAEAIKRRRLEEATSGSPHLSSASAPSSPTHAAQQLAGLSSNTSNQHLSAESICPVETLDLLIDDFFTYIHPLCPFPHEPSFREAWKRRDDLSNKDFLALLASMIGALVASFPRKPRLHLKAQKKEKLFPSHMSLVLRCQNICTGARGTAYLDDDNVSVYSAATSYFMALADFYTFRWRQGQLYLGECLTIIRTLGLHKAEPQGLNGAPHLVLPGSHPSNGHDSVPPVDNITREIGRRVFWTVFVTVKSMQQQGAATGEQIPPPTATDPYPPLPAEVDDFCIFSTHNERQPAGLVPVIAGFIANVHVYCSYNPLATMELAWGIDAVVDWERQKKVLYESLRRCKDITAVLPAELTVDPHGNTAGMLQQSDSSGVYEHFARAQMRDPTASLLGQAQPHTVHSPEQRRLVQCEIQKANIYASALSTRSYIIEKYWNLCEAHERARSPRPGSPASGITASGLDGLLRQPSSNPDVVELEMRQERESIMKDLLVMLGSIDVVNMEPNADSFTTKIRSIAGTLLDAPDERKGQLETEAQNYLSAFLRVLMKLERISTPANSDPDQVEDEEAELRIWSDLREQQQKFQQQGGVLGLS